MSNSKLFISEVLQWIFNESKLNNNEKMRAHAVMLNSSEIWVLSWVSYLQCQSISSVTLLISLFRLNMQLILLNVACWSYFESFQIVWSVQIILHRILRLAFWNPVFVASQSIWHWSNWLWTLMCFIVVAHHAHLEHIDLLSSCWQVLQHQCQCQTGWVSQMKEKGQSILQVL